MRLSAIHYSLLTLSCFALALFLRVFMLDVLPCGLFRDEAEKALNGVALAQTLRDLDGVFLPMFIKVMGVTTSATYQYACVPFAWVLGAGEWSARLPAVMAAMFALWFNFLFMRRAFGASAALLATLFLALSPWHIVFSRWAQQGIFLPMYAAFGLWMAVYWHQEKRWWALSLAAIAAAKMVYTYDVARLFVPLMLACAAVIYWRELWARRRDFAVALAMLAVGVAPVVWLMFFKTEAAQARFSVISIFTPGTSLGEQLSAFGRNYLNHWTPEFLLLWGDGTLRHGAGTGVLNIVEFAGLLCAAFWMVRTRSKAAAFWLCWMLLWPVAASLTRVGVPHALRSIVALPAIQNVAAIGLAFVIMRLDPHKIRTACLAVVLFTVAGFAYFATAYYGASYRQKSAVDWQYGVRQCIEFVAPHLSQMPLGSRVVFYNFQGAEYLVPYYRMAVLGESLDEATRTSSVFVMPEWNARFEDFAGDTSAPLVLVQPLNMQPFPQVDGGFMPIFGQGAAQMPENLAATIRWNRSYEQLRRQ